jgi:DNA-directed RNA polymerase specialized sigma24 family protein
LPRFFERFRFRLFEHGDSLGIPLVAKHTLRPAYASLTETFFLKDLSKSIRNAYRMTFDTINGGPIGLVHLGAESDSKDNIFSAFPGLSDTLRACFRRVCSWRIPTHWSRSDWCEEIVATGTASVCQAELEYDPKYGIPYNVFVYHRVLARCLTRYRQEWTYARHCYAGDPSDILRDEGDEDSFMRHLALFWNENGLFSSQSAFAFEDLYSALMSLPESDRKLIQRLFWAEETQAQVASELEVTQQAINKRKRAVIVRLQEILNDSPKKVSRRGCKKPESAQLQNCTRYRMQTWYETF